MQYKNFLLEEYMKTDKELKELPRDCLHKEIKDTGGYALRENGTCLIHDADTEGLSEYKNAIKKLYPLFR